MILRLWLDLFSKALLGRLLELLFFVDVVDFRLYGSGLPVSDLTGLRDPDRDDNDAAFLTVTTDDETEFERDALRR